MKNAWVTEDNMECLIETAEWLLEAVPVESKWLDICNHPFTNTTVFLTKNGTVQNLAEDVSAYQAWKEKWISVWKRCTTAEDLFGYVRASWQLCFLKYCRSYLTQASFSQLLASAWTASENPNMDPNVSIHELCDFFRMADKEMLMIAEDKKVYDALPEVLTVYRGVGCGRKERGMSWTRNLETATWFAGRWDTEEEQGYILQTTISKRNVLAYLNTRDEDEIVVDITRVRNTDIHRI